MNVVLSNVHDQGRNAKKIKKLFIVLRMQHIERNADHVLPQSKNSRGVQVSSIRRIRTQRKMLNHMHESNKKIIMDQGRRMA